MKLRASTLVLTFLAGLSAQADPFCLKDRFRAERRVAVRIRLVDSQAMSVDQALMFF